MKVKRVKIGSQHYDVLIHKDVVSLIDSPDQVQLGRILYADNTIDIAGAYSEPQVALIIVHEILHGLMHDNANSVIDPDMEEELVESLSNRLAAFMADNPVVMRELVKALSGKPE